MKKINDCEILNYIYKASNIIVIRIDIIKNNINNNKLSSILIKEKEYFINIINDTKYLLKKCNGIKEKISIIDKINNRLVIKNINTIIDGNKKILNEINKKLIEYNYNDILVYNLLIKFKNTIKSNNSILERNINKFNRKK